MSIRKGNLVNVKEFLKAEDSQIMEASSLDERFEMVELVLLLQFLAVPTEGSSFGSFLGCGGHVVETREKAARLSCYDRHR